MSRGTIAGTSWNLFPKAAQRNEEQKHRFHKIMTRATISLTGALCLALALASAATAMNTAARQSELTTHQFESLMNRKESLRGGGLSNEKSQSHRQVQSVRQSDSSEAASIRAALREIEERQQRSQTGFHADPEHWLSYQNHPFDKSDSGNKDSDSSHRNLQEVTDNGGIFRPMRIRFETGALDSLRDDTNFQKIDFIKNEILPRTAEFWSQALAVVPVSGNLFISTGELDNREYCGDYEFTRVPSEHISDGLEDADLVLYVSGTPSSRFCSFQTLAVAVACNFDQFDRPTAGAINVCLSTVTLDDDGTASPAVIQDNVDVGKYHFAPLVYGSPNETILFLIFNLPSLLSTQPSTKVRKLQCHFLPTLAF